MNYLQHVSGFLSPHRDVIRLIEEILGVLRLVQMRDQLRLQIVLHEVNEEMHDRLRHRVLNRFADYVVIRFDETLCGNNRTNE